MLSGIQEKAIATAEWNPTLGVQDNYRIAPREKE